MLGFDSRGLTNSKGDATMKIVNLGNETRGESHRNLNNLFNRPELGARASLFIVEDQGSYYNAINALTTYPANRV
jgi:hypothetical protein